MTPFRCAAVAILAVLPLPLAATQFVHPPPRRPLLAIVEGAAFNVALNRFNSLVLGAEWARTSRASISRNLRLGWEWDEDSFQTNMLAHPYNGGVYFNAGRANGLDFWESAPLAFLGSLTWEYFGENLRPSLNDLLMTSFGGIAVGEIFHRLAASIRDNRDRGSSRLWSELAALPFDPMGAFNRLGRRQWSATGGNPPEHAPWDIVLRVQAGGRYAPDSAPRVGAGGIEILYRDPLLHPYERPFDVFGIRASFGVGLDLLRASGRLFGKDFNDSTAVLRNALALNHRFDFVGNPAQRLGTQSVELGFYSRLQIGKRWAIRTHAFGDAILLGAIDAPGDGVGERTYDFGSGAGFRLQLGIEHQDDGQLTLQWQTDYLHAVSGAAADHVVRLASAEVTVPITRAIAVNALFTAFRRASRYSHRGRDQRDYPEVRLVLVWSRMGFGPHEAP